MSASTVTVGYPVHAVATFKQWSNRYGTRFTDWTAVCGVNGTKAGQVGVFGRAGTARKRELCPGCFPGLDHRTYIPDPVEVNGACQFTVRTTNGSTACCLRAGHKPPCKAYLDLEKL